MSNNNSVIAFAKSNPVIAETMKPVSQNLNCDQRYKETRNDFKRVIYYNKNSDSDIEVEFIDIYLPCNKLSLQLLANDTIISPKNTILITLKMRLPITFNYHFIYEDLPASHIKAMANVHNLLGISSHQCLFSANIKQSYWTVNVYPNKY